MLAYLLVYQKLVCFLLPQMLAYSLLHLRLVCYQLPQKLVCYQLPQKLACYLAVIHSFLLFLEVRGEP